MTQAFTKDELRSATRVLYAELRAVRFQEVDAAGLIFYPRMLEYFSDAYLGWLASLGYDMPARVADGSWRAPIVHAEADFLAPLRFGDLVTVEIVGAKV